MDHIVDVQLVQQRIAVLEHNQHMWWGEGRLVPTLETDAVNTTTSYNSPIRFMN